MIPNFAFQIIGTNHFGKLISRKGKLDRGKLEKENYKIKGTKLEEERK